MELSISPSVPPDTIHTQNTPSLHVALANGGKIEKATEERTYVWIE